MSTHLDITGAVGFRGDGGSKDRGPAVNATPLVHQRSMGVWGGRDTSESTASLVGRAAECTFF